jgi:predicted hotdog family 3-hydroxylacyl-ACP dehydratase
MPMLNIDIDSLIPHREKIKIISGILDVQENTAVSTAVVNSNWPLYDGEAVNSLVLIEAIAQTAAIIEGYKRKQRGESGVKGWLVGIKNAEFNVDKIPLHTNLVIMLESKYSFDNYGVVEGIIKTGEKVLATATLQALRLDDDNQQNYLGALKHE